MYSSANVDRFVVANCFLLCCWDEDLPGKKLRNCRCSERSEIVRPSRCLKTVNVDAVMRS